MLFYLEERRVLFLLEGFWGWVLFLVDVLGMGVLDKKVLYLVSICCNLLFKVRFW